ncbi:MAG: hypothetical protein KGR24_05985, partial [Planctomycetes bacterium]|nr:hypothetical protein [Planctomycetota bacterium]
MSSDRTWLERNVILPLCVGVVIGWLGWGIWQAITPRPTLGAANFGYLPDPDGTREFLAELEHPTFGDAAREAVQKARGVDTFLYRHVFKAHEQHYGTPWV